MERRVEAALERFTLERVAEELERTVDELLVPTTRRVDVRREVEDDTLFPA